MNVNKIILCFGLGLLPQAVIAMDAVIEEKEMNATITRFGKNGAKTEQVRLVLAQNEIEYGTCPRTMTFSADEQSKTMFFLTQEKKEGHHPRDKNFGYINDQFAVDGFLSGNYNGANTVTGYQITDANERGKQILAARICMKNFQTKQENIQNAIKDPQNLRVSSFSFPSLKAIIGATSFAALAAALFFFKYYQK